VAAVWLCWSPGSCEPCDAGDVWAVAGDPRRVLQTIAELTHPARNFNREKRPRRSMVTSLACQLMSTRGLKASTSCFAHADDIFMAGRNPSCGGSIFGFKRPFLGGVGSRQRRTKSRESASTRQIHSRSWPPRWLNASSNSYPLVWADGFECQTSSPESHGITTNAQSRHRMTTIVMPVDQFSQKPICRKRRREPRCVND
jgi:hypothetical protein